MSEGYRSSRRADETGLPSVTNVDHPGRPTMYTHFNAISTAEDEYANYHRLGWTLVGEGDATKVMLVQSGRTPGEKRTSSRGSG